MNKTTIKNDIQPEAFVNRVDMYANIIAVNRHAAARASHNRQQNIGGLLSWVTLSAINI